MQMGWWNLFKAFNCLWSIIYFYGRIQTKSNQIVHEWPTHQQWYGGSHHRWTTHDLTLDSHTQIRGWTLFIWNPGTEFVWQHSPSFNTSTYNFFRVRSFKCFYIFLKEQEIRHLHTWKTKKFTNLWVTRHTALQEGCCRMQDQTSLLVDPRYNQKLHQHSQSPHLLCTCTPTISNLCKVGSTV